MDALSDRWASSNDAKVVSKQVMLSAVQTSLLLPISFPTQTIVNKLADSLTYLKPGWWKTMTRRRNEAIRSARFGLEYLLAVEASLIKAREFHRVALREQSVGDSKDAAFATALRLPQRLPPSLRLGTLWEARPTRKQWSSRTATCTWAASSWSTRRRGDAQA